MQNRFFGFFLLCFFLFACGPKVPPQVSLPENERLQVLKEVETFTRFKNPYLHSARGYAKVRLKIKGKEATFEEVILLKRPHSFRFETLDDLGGTRFIIASEGSKLYWQDFSRREYGESDQIEKVLRRFLPLSSSLEETLGLLLGRVLLPDLSEAKVFREKDPSEYRLQFPQGEILWDSEARVIVFLALKGESGKFSFQYRGGKFLPRQVYGTKETRVWVPSRVILKDLRSKSEMEIDYRELEVGLIPLSSSSLFTLDPLPDAKRVDEIR